MAKKTSIDKEVIDSIRDKLDNAVNARYAETAPSPKKSFNLLNMIKWLLAAAVMLASLAAFWLLQKPEKSAPEVKFYSVENLVSLERQAWQEDADMLDDIDFYTWLAFDQSLPEEGAK